MKEYEVWMEGYAATGEHQRASFEGKVMANSFDEACIKLLGDRLDKDEKQPDGYRRYPDNFCVWACTLYDNEADARKGFG